MKRLFCILILITIFQKSPVHAQQVSVSIGYQSFYDQLSPYGEWVSYPGYGYVWKYRFSAYPAFRPYYSRGSWVYTDLGWTWVSDYPWGWATFHYGRWFYDVDMGWLWIPGEEWAPAWVTWGAYENDFCWAPLGPNISIGFIASYRPPANYWVVCPGAYFGRPGWNTHVENIVHNTTIVRNITVINNNVSGHMGGGSYLRGPDPKAVERFTNVPVRPVAVAEGGRAGSARVTGNKLEIYRPVVHREAGGAGKAVPSHVSTPDKFHHATNPAGNERVNNHPVSPAKPASPSPTRSRPAPTHPAPTHPVPAHPTPTRETPKPPPHQVNPPPRPPNPAPHPPVRPPHNPSRPPHQPPPPPRKPPDAKPVRDGRDGRK